MMSSPSGVTAQTPSKPTLTAYKDVPFVEWFSIIKIALLLNKAIF